MNKIAFTGTGNHASSFTVMGTEDSKRKIVSHKILCTLNNNGTKDAYDFENLLDEFKYSKKPEDKNKLVFEVINDISDKDIKIMSEKDLEKIKEEYAPHCLGVRINGKPVNVFKNNLYIFKKLQNLANDISEIRPIDLLFQKKTLDKKEILSIMIGQYQSAGNKKEALAQCFKPENIKLNSVMISTSLHDIIKHLVSKK